MQYIYFLVLERDTTRNINIPKCLHLQRRYAANRCLNFFVWSHEMSKLLKSQAVVLPEIKPTRMIIWWKMLGPYMH